MDSPGITPLKSEPSDALAEDFTGSSKASNDDPLPRITQVSVWACITIIGQLILMAVALTFFILVHTSHTPLQQNIAEWGKGSPRGLTFCVTILATLCSSLSTFLFSKGLILFLTSHSNRPTSLFSFLAVTSLSRGAAVFSLRHANWTMATLLGLVLMNSLTASFTTILTPTPLIVNVPIRGTEFAMNSPKFSEIMADPQQANSFPMMNGSVLRLNNQVAASSGPVLLTAAYASAGRALGYPGILTYLGMPFNSTTGGVMPAIPSTAEVFNTKPELANYLNFDILKPRFEFTDTNFKPSKVFPFNYTTSQQGFSADVRCQVLPTQSSPEQPGIRIQFEQNISLPDRGVTGFWRYFIQCPSQVPTNRTFLLRPAGSAVISGSCLNMDYDGHRIPGSQLFIVGGYGPMYSFISPRACQFTPYFTLSEVMYSHDVNISRIISRESITAATAPIAYAVYRGIIDAATQYAVDVRNKVGDDLAALYGSTSELDSVNDFLLNTIMENYFRGIIETRATLFKTPPVIAGRGRVVLGSSPELSADFAHNFEGVWSYETLGWHSATDSTRATFIGIIPILTISLVTIILTAYSWISLRHHKHLSKEPFDPNNMVALLRAGRDGSVVDRLANQNHSGSTHAGGRVKIQLERNSRHWHLRPAVGP